MTADDPLGLAAARERKQLIISDYETNPKRIRAVALLEYRCRRDGCLLLHVWRSPDGLLFYRPAFKQSPRFNAERSNAAGRARKRWVRTDGRDVKQKFYRRRHDADSFAARLAGYDKPVTVYATAATWTETERTSR